MTVALVTLSLLAMQKQNLTYVEEQKAQLVQSRPLPDVTSPRQRSAVTLPPMLSSAIVRKFNSVAADMNLAFDEVAYSLESTERSPYLRYRITLTTQAGYIDIRRFLAALSAELPNATLDSIRCARPDAVQALLGCELAFTAFFRKP